MPPQLMLQLAQKLKILQAKTVWLSQSAAKNIVDEIVDQLAKDPRIVEAYIKRLKDMEDLALSYNGVVKTYAIQAGRELRVVVGSEKISDAEAEKISFDIAKRIQDEMTYPGQVKVTVIRETRAIAYAK